MLLNKKWNAKMFVLWLLQKQQLQLNIGGKAKSSYMHLRSGV